MRPFYAVPLLVTLAMLAVAGVAGWMAWSAYMGPPWTRDGTVRAYVVSIAPEVSGRIVSLPVADNQFVHKGDVLMTIDPSDYAIAVDQAEASVAQAQATADNANLQSERRARLNTLETSIEEAQTYRSTAVAANAAYRGAVANLARAKLNMERTTIRSPVNGYVTNLHIQLGDYANTGQAAISVINSDSFWVDAYFEETALPRIRVGDEAVVKLMGSAPLLEGHVDSIARGISVANATAGGGGLATVNPIFTWVRLAQRVPVRIRIDRVPAGVLLVAGRTASVEVRERRLGQVP